MSLSEPSHVSATTGSDQSYSLRLRACFTSHSMTASRTTPTECVFVIITGPHRKPASSSQVVPVISPLPFSVNHPAKTGSPERLRSEEHTSELQSLAYLVCRLLLEK